MHKFIGLRILAGLGLAAGTGLLLCRMAELRHEMLDEADREPQGQGEPRFMGHSPWRRGGYPPMFGYWHRQAHAHDQALAPEADKAKPAPEAAPA